MIRSYASNDARLNVVHRTRLITLIALVMFALSLAATGWAWRANRTQARDRARIRLQQEVDRTRANIRMRLVVYEDALYGTRSLFEANRVVTRQMFRDYVANLKLEQRYPGIQGIGYAQWVSPADKAAHTARVRSEGNSGYMIRPEGERPEYTSIIYLEPLNWRNQRAFGYDMFSDPIRQAAMKRARDTGMVSMTSKVKLVQETDTNVQAGFLMYLPLYRRDVPLDTVADRRAALLGYIYSPFRMGDLLSEVSKESPALSRFEIFSGRTTARDALMYREPEAQNSGQNYRPSATQVTETEFGGEIWTIQFSSTPYFDEVVREGENGVLLPAGILISFLLLGVLLSLARTQQRAVRLADVITAKLRESEEHVRAITETATDAIISADSRGRIVYFNPAAERIFCYPVKEAVGQPVMMLMPQGFQAAHVHSFERFLKSFRERMSGKTVEMTGRRADGSEFPLSVSLSTWHAGEVFFTGIMRDITDRKLAETNIRRLNQELTDALFRSEKLAITGRLMATIAHEINNPLAALMNLLFVLESEQLSPSAREFVRMAQDQVNMLANISRQTLTPYREGRYPAVTNVSELLDDVLSMLRPKLLAAKIHVVRRYPSLVEVTLYPSELRQVFTNLVANAIDAMPQGGRLTLTVSSENGRVNISVADTGTGIAPQHRGKLFDSFFTTKGEHGTGVGLWVVKEIVDRVGGSIAFVTSSDSQDHGTTFTVSVPVTISTTEQPVQEPIRGTGA